MTIKQQGGIFGRNPTFNNVDVEGTLTVNGEPISDFGTMAQQDADAVAITGGSGDFTTLTVDVDTLFVDSTNDRIGVNNGTPLERLDVDGNIKFAGSRNNAARKLGTLAGPHYNNSTEEDFLAMRIDAQINANVLSIGGASGGHNSATSLDFYTGANSTTTGGTLALQINSSQNVNVKAGNLVIGTSGKGIDFSATSGTGTSELFDDYEEGTWTPTLTTDGTDFTSVTYDGITSGSYTKVGNLVHVQFTFRTDAVTVGSASGAVRLGGLPFTAKTGNGGLATLSISSSASWSGEQPSAILIISGTNAGNFVYRTAADGALSNTAVADVNTGSDANLIRASGTYLV